MLTYLAYSAFARGHDEFKQLKILFSVETMSNRMLKRKAMLTYWQYNDHDLHLGHRRKAYGASSES